MTTNISILKQTFIIYLFIFGFSLLLTLIFQSRKKWDRNMWISTLSWFGIFLIFLITAYFGMIYFGCLIFIIGFIGIREYYILNNIWKTPYNLLSGLFLILMLYAIIFHRINFFYLIPGISLIVFLLFALFRNSLTAFNKETSIGIMGLLYWGWLSFHFSLLRSLEGGFGYIVLLCSLIAIEDNTAYYIGKLLGKRSKKLAPRISPNKTWIGAIGGFIIVFPFAYLFKYAVPQISYSHLFIIAFLTGITVPFGDLIESAMKRDIGVKDSGIFIPGHGGIMDRFDSWIFAVPFIYYYIYYTFK